jgi:hypothetical protein
LNDVVTRSNGHEITEEVLHFLTRYIETVPHLEALLLLWENPEVSWTAEEIASRIYVRPGTAMDIARQLTRRGLIVDVQGKYHYSTQWPNNESVAKVAAAYRQNLIPIATFIHTK